MNNDYAIFIAPLSFQIGNKNRYINLNNYHNWHFTLKSKIKREYERIIQNQALESKHNFKKINLTFILYPPDKRRRDRANALCLHEKYFCDGLVKAEALKDDCDKFIESTTYMTGAVDKTDPRVEIHISEA